MKIGMRSLVLTGLLVAVSSPLGAADTVLSRLAGWWDEGVDHDALCAEGRPRHRIVHDPKDKILTFEFDKPVKRYDGVEHSRATYQVLGSSVDTAKLRFEHETRQAPDGSLVEWELVLVDPTTYRWRASHSPTGTYNKIIGKRCDK